MSSPTLGDAGGFDPPSGAWGGHGPPVDAHGRVPGVDHGPDDVTPPTDLDDAPVDTVRVYLDPAGSGLFPSLYLVEVGADGLVTTYILSAESLPDVRRMSWRTRAILGEYVRRLEEALRTAR